MTEVKCMTLEDRRALELVIPGWVCGFFGGSRAICNPPPMDTDNDLCILVKDIDRATRALENAGFTAPPGVSRYAGEHSDFVTLRRGEINIMLFSNPMEFGAVLGATAIAKQQNVMQKAERYRMFEAARAWWRGGDDVFDL